MAVLFRFPSLQASTLLHGKENARQTLLPAPKATKCMPTDKDCSRRNALVLMLTFPGFSILSCGEAHSVSTSKRALRSQKIPESEYTVLPNGLKYFDLKVGGGSEAVKGSRVAVHYVAKWRGVTFMTSRQGLGVTGGTPYGFEVGSSNKGYVLTGLDLGVEGMKVGGQRVLIVPPELAYGNKGIQEIPPNATLECLQEKVSSKVGSVAIQDSNITKKAAPE